MKNLLAVFFIFSSFFALSQNDLQVQTPKIILKDVLTEFEVSTSITDTNQILLINSVVTDYQIKENTILFNRFFQNEETLLIEYGGKSTTINITPIPLWLSILPPLIAIVLALAFKEVITSLFVGLLSGVVIIGGYSNGLTGILEAPFRVIDTYILNALVDGVTEGLGSSDHLSIILFSLLIGGVVSVISKNGGMQGIVNRISRIANNSKNGQLATFFLGIGIFFDDYANTLVVGNTMRSLTDKLKISREKLAYIVDSTAAPIAAIALVTTWVGAELQYISEGVNVINSSNQQITQGTYAIFINSLQYSFYPIFTLFFMFFLIKLGKDYGPMYQAEKTARTGTNLPHSSSHENLYKEELEEFTMKKGVQARTFNALIPILIIVVGTIVGLFITGWDTHTVSNNSLSLAEKVSFIIGNSNSYVALLWSSISSLIIAILLSVFQKLLSLSDAIDSAIKGFKTMMNAVIILVLAWGLAITTKELHTSDFLISLLGDEFIPWLIPVITFLLGAIIAFSTGSSWSTMAILYPLMLPVAWKVGLDNNLDVDMQYAIFYNTIASVLAGSVLGDHCSPISDTTILSSLACDCDHIQHVRTQIPYAITVGVVSILIGIIPGALGVSSLICFPIGIGILYLIVKYVGKDTFTPMES